MLGLRVTVAFLTISLSLLFPAARADPSVLDLRALVSKNIEPKPFGPAKWLEDGAAYTVLEDSDSIKGARDIVRYETATGRRTVWVNARALTPTGAQTPLSVDGYEWSNDKTRLLIYTNAQKVWRQNTRGDYWMLDRLTHRLHQLGGRPKPGALMFASISPDARHVAYLRRDSDPLQVATNLYVEDVESGAVTSLTADAEVRSADGTGRTIINGTSDWVNEEEFGLRKAYEWSPDGRQIAYLQFDETNVQDFLFINNTDTRYPIVTAIPYPMAGTANASVRLGVVSVTGGPTRWLGLNSDPANHYIPRIGWSPDGRAVFVQQFDRPQQNLDLVAADASTGAVRRVLHEHADTWIDLVDDFRWLRSGREFLWISEADGWRHAYVVPRSGGTARLVTRGEFDVSSIAGLDEKRGWLYFAASPDNATQLYLYRERLDGKGVAERITPPARSGTHQYDVSPNGHWAFHTFSRVDVPPNTDLVSLPAHRERRMLIDNERLRVYLRPLFATPTEFFRIAMPSGDTLDGWMIKPPDFDPGKKYPVLVYVYGEPFDRTVVDSWNDEGVLFHRHIAAQGYIVISIENRGTPALKGYAWRHAIYGAIGLLAADEQAAALRALTAQRPYLDVDRVAVWGWSGGGSMTLHLMFRYPQVYKVGMAVAPVPDQRYYDTIYQERYMGTPQSNPDGYKRGSPISYVEGLTGHLLIVSGTGDDNAHYQVTQLLLNRLITLGKPFELMEYPNRTHAINEGEGTRYHLFSMLARYLDTHLPPSEAHATQQAAPDNK